MPLIGNSLNKNTKLTYGVVETRQLLKGLKTVSFRKNHNVQVKKLLMNFLGISKSYTDKEWVGPSEQNLQQALAYSKSLSIPHLSALPTYQK